MDYTVHGILQARILEWVAFPFSRGSSQPSDWTQVSLIAGVLYLLGHQGSPRILEWVAYPFSSRSSQHRNWTGVSCIAGGFFTNWAIREAQPWKAFFQLKNVLSYSLKRLGLHSPWNSPGQNTGVGSLSLLQGIFPSQGSNPGLLLCRQILYQLSHNGSSNEYVSTLFS